ncbi:MAG: 50S ribosomal protein L21 [Anaerolineales bacterium]|nr:50S ribosomal protein L21 [Anaerolineales bacterium]
MKYAVVESGGKQYIAREGETIEVDRLSDEIGSKITFDAVLLVSDDGKTQVGTPYLDSVQVKGTIAAQIKGPKLLVFKYKPKERYRRRRGHRQQYTRVLIDKISAKKAPAKEKTEPES